MVSRITFGDFQFDPATGDLHGSSGLVELTPKALELLGYLTTHAGRLVTKQELLDALWPDVFVTDGVLKVCVREIRRALDDDARLSKQRIAAGIVSSRRCAPTPPFPAALKGPPHGRLTAAVFSTRAAAT
jgi:DNA-binding winged helix-turn-helix (wHTH) protein